MARQGQLSEFNTFVGGLFTEASPLTYPDGTAIDLDNFELNKDGSVNRRRGINLETGWNKIITNVPTTTANEAAVSSFRWDNVSGIADKSLLVVQVGNELHFFNAAKGNQSNNKVGEYVVADSDGKSLYSYAQVDGMLVVATGLPELLSFESSLLGVSPTPFRLRTRDVFGVQDGAVGFGDFRSAENVSTRQFITGIGQPTPSLLYNLRNMSWSPLRLPEDNDDLEDPISTFVRVSDLERWPSYADNVTSSLYPDPENSNDRISDRLNISTMLSNPAGNFEAPNGYFVIDLLDRGASREEELQKLTDSSPEYVYRPTLGGLPTDRTPEGASVITEYAGRVWYAGFSGELIGGDRHSPRLSSYIMFSKLVEDVTDLRVCHQKGDPTSRDFSELLDTDGGFIRIDEAYNIQALCNIGDRLVVLAENGVWAVLGGSGYGFTATDYKVVKLSEMGIVGKNSWVIVDKSVLYWSDEGINQVVSNEIGDLSVQDLTSGTIQTFYNGISTVDKRKCKALYDSYQRKVVWLYGWDLSSNNGSKELVLDITLGAFYKSTFGTLDSSSLRAVSLYESLPYSEVEEEATVVVGSDLVVAGSDNVLTTMTSVLDSVSETSYVVLFTDNDTVELSFAKKFDQSFKDWDSVDGTGGDAPAYLVTGYISGNDYQRNKQVPYVTFHFNRTEDGFELDSEENIIPSNQSSCKVQAQWEWADSPNSGRWGREFQAYRYKRYYIPENVNDNYDYGFSTITTKSKLRGKGKVVSLYIKSEEGKDCQLLGWSMFSDVAMRV